jgi:hypothetical protein
MSGNQLVKKGWVLGLAVLLGTLPTAVVARPKLRQTLKGHTEWIGSVAYSPDGKALASASGDKTIKLWDAKTGKEMTTLKGHANSVASVAFCPEGKTLASGSWDNTIKLWDVASGKERASLKGVIQPTFVTFPPATRCWLPGPQRQDRIVGPPRREGEGRQEGGLFAESTGRAKHVKRTYCCVKIISLRIDGDRQPEEAVVASSQRL